MKLLRNPLVALLGVVVVVTMALHALFFACSTWLWGFAKVVNLAEITPWARWAMTDRDGIEPYAMIVIVLLQWGLTALGVVLLARLGPRWRAAVVAALLGAAATFAWRVPPVPPLPAIDLVYPSVLRLIVVSLLAVVFVRWTLRQRAAIPASLAAALVPFCFVRVTLPSLMDQSSILGPALRLRDGIPISQIYLQYDLLPSLLGVAWMKVGGDSLAFWVVLAGVLYATLLGLVFVGRRLFSRPMLVAPMLVSIVLVRLYGVWGDPLMCPQVTPVRLDLWVTLVAATLVVGLRHWVVGLVVACLCFFSRSMGLIYVGAYFLALGADFLGERRDQDPRARPPLTGAVRALVLEVAPSLGLVAASFVAARVVLGSFSSASVALYRELGLGMMRVASTSFYWWLLALTGAVGWLAYSRRGRRSPRRAQAAILAVALTLANSVYFFGRSHEHNLLNISIIFLFCAFLGLDLAWPASDEASDEASGEASDDEDSRVVRTLLRLAPLLIVVVCAYSYSARALEKLAAQAAHLETTTPIPPTGPNDTVPDLHCDEVRRAVGDDRAYFYSKNDYWYYERCKFVPQGYFQPMFLAALQKSLADDVTGLLSAGYKIVVPRLGGDFAAAAFPTVLPLLPPTDVTETPNFRVYQSRAHATK